MIILNAHMWPHGNQAQAYELLHATITNQSSPGDLKDSYFAHVLSRPAEGLGVLGFEADVEVRDHERSHGFGTLLMSILAAAVSNDPEKGVFIPPSRTLVRLTLQDVAAFQVALKART